MIADFITMSRQAIDEAYANAQAQADAMDEPVRATLLPTLGNVPMQPPIDLGIVLPRASAEHWRIMVHPDGRQEATYVGPTLTPEEIHRLHREAMEHVDHAKVHEWHDNPDAAQAARVEAAKLERASAMAVVRGPELPPGVLFQPKVGARYNEPGYEPTRTILLNSACWLSIRAGLLDQARHLARVGLDYRPTARYVDQFQTALGYCDGWQDTASEPVGSTTVMGWAQRLRDERNGIPESATLVPVKFRDPKHGDGLRWLTPQAVLVWAALDSAGYVWLADLLVASEPEWIVELQRWGASDRTAEHVFREGIGRVFGPLETAVRAWDNNRRITWDAGDVAAIWEAANP
jgi:hypothetical protein